MTPSGPNPAPPPMPVSDEERTPDLGLESKLLSKIATLVLAKVDGTGGIEIIPGELVEELEQFSIIPPILLRIILLNPGTCEPAASTPLVVAEALSRFIYETTRDMPDIQARRALAGAFFGCASFDQFDQMLVDILPAKYGAQNSGKPNDRALDYTTYYFKLYGPVMKRSTGSSYVYGPRFVASRWVDERNADIALSAFYEQAALTGVEALREMSNLMTNARDQFYDPSFGGFDLNNFKRFRLEKKKLPPDRVCPTESWAVTVSW